MGRRVFSGFEFAIVLGLALAGACANDFDALFDNPASSGTDGGSDSGAPTNDASVSDGGATADVDASLPPRCMPPITSCTPQSDCDNDDKCTFECKGCECGCNLDCKIIQKVDDPDCRGECTGGAHCDAGCATGGPCELRTKDSDSMFWCSGIATSCSQRCEGRSNYCNVKCDITGPCSLECRDGVPCLLDCGNNATSCTLKDCPSGKLKECVSGKRYACNRECPN